MLFSGWIFTQLFSASTRQVNQLTRKKITCRAFYLKKIQHEFAQAKFILFSPTNLKLSFPLKGPSDLQCSDPNPRRQGRRSSLGPVKHDLLRSSISQILEPIFALLEKSTQKWESIPIEQARPRSFRSMMMENKNEDTRAEGAST